MSIDNCIAISLLACVVIVFVIDMAAELDVPFLRYKWGLLWYAARYLGIICAILLALDKLFG
jgi:hypothetical protein